MKKEQKKERSQAAIQQLAEKDLQTTKAGTVSSMGACDCVCIVSADCAC